MSAPKPIKATVQSSTQCQGGDWLSIVRLARPKQDVSIRSPQRLGLGSHLRVQGAGSAWERVA